MSGNPPSSQKIIYLMGKVLKIAKNNIILSVLETYLSEK
jgi:hypothetical protein